MKRSSYIPDISSTLVSGKVQARIRDVLPAKRCASVILRHTLTTTSHSIRNTAQTVRRIISINSKKNIPAPRPCTPVGGMGWLSAVTEAGQNGCGPGRVGGLVDGWKGCDDDTVVLVCVSNGTKVENALRGVEKWVAGR